MIKIQELEDLGFVIEDDVEDEYRTYRWVHPTKDIKVDITFDWTKAKGESNELIEFTTGVNWEHLNITTTQRLKTFINILTA